MSNYTPGLRVENWEINPQNFPESVHRVTNAHNLIGLKALMANIHGLAQPQGLTVDNETGLESVLLTDRSHSRTEALCLFNPMGNRVTDHQLLRAKYLMDVMAASGVHDEGGRPLPALIVGSPAGSTGPRTTKEERDQIAEGDFNPIANIAMQAVNRRNFNQLRIMGHSLGGVLALAAPAAAYRHGIDTKAIAVGDAVCSKPYPTLRELFSDFAADSKHLRDEVQNAGLHPYTEAQKMEPERGVVSRTMQDLQYGLGLARQARINIALGRGMAVAQYGSLLDSALAYTPQAGIAHATNDQLLASFEDVEEKTRRVSACHRETSVVLTRIPDARHTWGDNLPAVASYAVKTFLQDS